MGTRGRTRHRWPRGTAVVALAATITALVVISVGAPHATASAVRTYYIAADEVAWDYAPSGQNGITGEPFEEEAGVFVTPGPTRIGQVYLKALYREYTDATFSTLKPVPPVWAHLGALGPVIRAEVGDTINVHFRNNARFAFTMHPHGVFYDKSSEGAPYADGTRGDDRDDDAVPPGGEHVYDWRVPERAGPGPGDGSSVVWMYHSHVDEPGDTNAGLIGPLIITAAGKARADASPSDVDRELVTMFTVFDENRSPYLGANVEAYAGKPNQVRTGDPDFVQSNLMHTINGRVYGNLEGLTMAVGERVRWYQIAMGTEVDLHTPHWHGQTLTWMGMRTDAVELLPGSMKTLDMTPDNAGEWLFHCHVNDHIDAGMIATFEVAP